MARKIVLVAHDNNNKWVMMYSFAMIEQHDVQHILVSRNIDLNLFLLPHYNLTLHPSLLSFDSNHFLLSGEKILKSKY